MPSIVPWLALGLITACHFLLPSLPALPPGLIPATRCVLVVVLLVVAARRRSPSAAPALVIAMVVPVLALVACSLLTGSGQLGSRLPVARHGMVVRVEGRVLGVPAVGAARCRFRFLVERANGQPRRWRLDVRWYAPMGEALAPAAADDTFACAALHPGERWELMLRLASPRGRANPGTFDLDRWLFRHGIDGRATVRYPERAAKVGEAGAHEVLSRLRLALADRLAAGLPARISDALPLLTALTLGLRADLPALWREALQRTGTGHLFAISGLHVGLVAGAVWAVSRRLPGYASRAAVATRPPASPALAAVAAAAIFSLLAGFTLPTQRALIMLVLGLGFPVLSGMRLSGLRVMSLSLLVVLLLDPLAPLDPGFWLSFGAVICLILGQRYGHTLARRAVMPQAVLWLGLLAPGIGFFGQISWVAPLANLVAVTAFSLIIVPFGLAGTLASALAPPIATPLLIVAGESVLLALRALVWLADWPPAATAMHRPLWTLLCLQGAALLWLLQGVPRRALALLLVLPVLLWRPASVPHGALELTLLDVGQGLAAVLRTRRHTLLYDAGPQMGGTDGARQVILPWLGARGVRTIDLIVISHGDLDHRGGLASLRQAFPASPVLGGDRGHGAWQAFCRASHGFRWDGVSFAFLHPDGDVWQGNDGSCVLKVSVGAGPAVRSVLLTGDVQRPAEVHLLTHRSAALASDVVVAPHHGSATSSSVDFVRATGARWVLFPVGYGNRWGLPAREVVARWRAHGATAVTTAQAGAITVTVRPGRPLRIERERRRRPYWSRADRADAQGSGQ